MQNITETSGISNSTTANFSEVIISNETEGNSTISVTNTEKHEETATTISTTQVATESKIDIDYYINYAKNYAKTIGLKYDSSATDCWDNPISITPKTVSTIANIESRLNRCKNVEGFESVCIWYEKVGENNYEIYIGYA